MDRFEAFRSFITDPDFARLFSLMANKPVGLAEFEKLKMPQGCKAVELFEMMVLLRKYANASGYPYFSIAGVRWITPTKSMLDDMSWLNTLSNRDAPLSKSLERRNGMHFVISPLIKDIQSALARDGLDIDTESLYEVLSGIREPDTESERFARNVRTLGFRIADELDKPLDGEYLGNLIARLKIGTAGLPRLEINRPLPDDGTVYYHDTQRAREYICYSFEKTDISFGESVLQCVSASTMCYYYQPFGNFTGMVEYLLRQRFFLQRGLPALAFAPLSAIHLTYNKDSERLKKLCLEANDEGDWAPYSEEIIAQIKESMMKLDNKMKEMDEKTKRLLDKVRMNPLFSDRQIEILKKALMSQDTSFTITGFRSSYHVSNGTARNDLLTLTDLGLFYREFQGKRLVFKPSPSLERLIETADWSRFQHFAK